MPAQNNILPFSVRRSQKLATDDWTGYIDNAFNAQGKRILLSTDLDLFFYSNSPKIPGSPLKILTNQYGAICLSLYLESVGASSRGITAILNQFPSKTLTLGDKRLTTEPFPFFTESLNFLHTTFSTTRPHVPANLKMDGLFLNLLSDCIENWLCEKLGEQPNHVDPNQQSAIEAESKHQAIKMAESIAHALNRYTCN